MGVASFQQGKALGRRGAVMEIIGAILIVWVIVVLGILVLMGGS